MAKKRVTTIIDRIEADFRKLAKVTGVNHISAALIDGSFMIDDYANLGNQKFSEYRPERKKDNE